MKGHGPVSDAAMRSSARAFCVTGFGASGGAAGGADP
jgi:hypothetical protein